MAVPSPAGPGTSTSHKNCSEMALGTWQRAQGFDPASTFPGSQSDGASVRWARTSPSHGSPTVEAWTQDLWGCPLGFLLFQGTGGGSFESCGLRGGAFMDWTSPHKLNGIEIWGIWGLGRHFLLFVVFLGPFLRSFHGPAWRSAGLLQSGSATVMMWWTWSPTVFGFYPYDFKTHITLKPDDWCWGLHPLAR